MKLFLFRTGPVKNNRLFMRMYLLGLVLCSTVMQVNAKNSPQTINILKSNASGLQDGIVSGEVKDEAGHTLPGVSVQVKGTNRGSVTDQNGRYTIPVEQENGVLQFTFVGFSPQEVEVGGKRLINIVMKEDAGNLEEVVVIGYGTARKKDLTGSVTRVDGETFKNQSISQLTEMLSGTVAGFASNQSATAAGGASMELRGPNSLSAGTSPLVVLDGVVYNGGISDINPNDIESIDILKDASSAAVYGSRAASGVILITTKTGKTGKPTINFTSKVGLSDATNVRRGLGPEEYISFRQDYLRTINPAGNFDFYTHPGKLPSGVSIEDWRSLSPNPQADDNREWLSRLKFFSVEQENYLAGRTIDWYDEVFRKGFRQDYDLSIGGKTENIAYYWSIGVLNNTGIRQGDKYSSVRSRLNADYRINNWLNVGVNAQFSDRDDSGIPASLGFYANSPFGQMYDDNGNVMRLPHGHTDNPLLNLHRQDKLTKVNGLFTNLYADVKLPFGIDYRVSFQPRYESMKDFLFTSTDEKRGGERSDISEGSRTEYSHYEWMVDNILKWNKQFGAHRIDATLLYNIEESTRWSSTQTNKNFAPNENLGYHGLQFGDGPTITNNDYRSTGDAMMARVNYSLLDRYLFTASVRRDGYSAFGQKNPRATFPALAFAWRVSEEAFFGLDMVNDLKIRASWGVNGNRDIGRYSALARIGSNLWFDGSSTRVGLFNSSLANSDLRWEKTESINLGVDAALWNSRVVLSLDYYDMTTRDLLLERRLPSITGFSNITSNLGELGNKGVEVMVQTRNVDRDEFKWNSSLTFSLNRNKIKKLFGDLGDYTILGEARNGEIPDFTNEWFPGHASDAVWDYDLTGVWQVHELDEAAKYGMRPGDFKAVDVDGDGVYNELYDKQFIGHYEPRYRIGLNNEVKFLSHFTASVFLRADLGHIGNYSKALNVGWESNDRRSRHVGPVPYWTPQNPINDYARLDVSTSGYGGGLRVFKPRSFLRVQDVVLSYNAPASVYEKLGTKSLSIFMSVRNLATFTKWPDWDPESGTTPMPRHFTFGLNLSL